jgi:hypothetical protein
MDLSELVVLLHYEVQKSYDFVEAVSRTEADGNASVLHLALEQVEIDLPASLEEVDSIFDPQKVIELPLSTKLLKVPYTPESATQKGWLPKKAVIGKAVSVKSVSPIEKPDQRVAAETIGRIRVILKPIISQ